jgi:hypothetical protein
MSSIDLTTISRSTAMRATEIESGLGNLSKKNRLRDRFSSSKSRQVTGQRFLRPNFRQESRTGF